MASWESKVIFRILTMSVPTVAICWYDYIFWTIYISTCFISFLYICEASKIFEIKPFVAFMIHTTYKWCQGVLAVIFCTLMCFWERRVCFPTDSMLCNANKILGHVCLELVITRFIFPVVKSCNHSFSENWYSVKIIVYCASDDSYRKQMIFPAHEYKVS